MHHPIYRVRVCGQLTQEVRYYYLSCASFAHRPGAPDASSRANARRMASRYCANAARPVGVSLMLVTVYRPLVAFWMAMNPAWRKIDTWVLSKLLDKWNCSASA